MRINGPNETNVEELLALAGLVIRLSGRIGLPRGSLGVSFAGLSYLTDTAFTLPSEFR
jgi:hypothetical protein